MVEIGANFNRWTWTCASGWKVKHNPSVKSVRGLKPLALFEPKEPSPGGVRIIPLSGLYKSHGRVDRGLPRDISTNKQ